MSEPITTKPTPFSQFCLFKSLSLSLFEDDWFNMVESWQAMVAVNAPIPEFAYNMAPFFANAPRLLPIFYRYLGFAEQVLITPCKDIVVAFVYFPTSPSLFFIVCGATVVMHRLFEGLNLT
jgi:hypothetical protein